MQKKCICTTEALDIKGTPSKVSPRILLRAKNARPIPGVYDAASRSVWQYDSAHSLRAGAIRTRVKVLLLLWYQNTISDKYTFHLVQVFMVTPVQLDEVIEGIVVVEGLFSFSPVSADGGSRRPVVQTVLSLFRTFESSWCCPSLVGSNPICGPMSCLLHN